MGFVLTDEEKYLQDAAKKFVDAEAPVEALRKLRDDKDETGFSKDLWKAMAELGWPGILIPEEYGGLDFGYTGLGVVLEETGRALVASPLVSTVLVCGSAVKLAGSDEQKKDILSAIAVGERLLALAVDESAHHNPSGIAVKAEKSGDGYEISGEKVFVLDGHVADQLIVAARTSGKPGDEDGITLFIVDAKAKGVNTTRTIMVDSRNAACVVFDEVEVGANAVLGEVDKGFATLDRVLDIGRIGVAAEMLGGAQEAFDRTLAYLKTREQFGAVIGSFQALKHRAATMFCEIELSKSVVRAALTALDEDRDDVAKMASLAKSQLCDTFELVSNEGIQMHGGIGMTDEEEIGFFLKRARVAQQTFGDAAFHRNRFATLCGY